MNFQDAVKSSLNKYAVFEGRASRSEYWWFFLFNITLYVAAIVLDSILSFGFLSMIVSLGLLAPSLAVGARRLHDINKSGWWQLLYLIPLIGFIIVLIFLVKQGDAGENRFGPVAE